MHILLGIIFAPLLIYLGLVGLLAFFGLLVGRGGVLAVLAILTLMCVAPFLLFVLVIGAICLGSLAFLYRLAKG